MNAIRRVLVLAAVAVPLLAQTQTAPPAAAPPAAAAPAAAAEVWVADKPHSSVMFEIRHLMSDVPGRFRDFDATVRMDRAEPARSSVELTIQAASIDTNDGGRDEHLRSPDFFDAAKYPAITFKSTSVVPKSANDFEVTGDLTMHGVTKRITLPVTFRGFMPDARGTETAGFKLRTTLDRKDYNISWNRILDEGGLLLGDEVTVSVSLSMRRQSAAAAAAR